MNYNAPTIDDVRRHAAAYWNARAEEKAFPESIWFYHTARHGGNGFMIWRGTVADAQIAWNTLRDLAAKSGKRGSLVWSRNYPEGDSGSVDQANFAGA